MLPQIIKLIDFEKVSFKRLYFAGISKLGIGIILSYLLYFSFNKGTFDSFFLDNVFLKMIPIILFTLIGIIEYLKKDIYIYNISIIEDVIKIEWQENKKENTLNIIIKNLKCEVLGEGRTTFKIVFTDCLTNKILVKQSCIGIWNKKVMIDFASNLAINGCESVFCFSDKVFIPNHNNSKN